MQGRNPRLGLPSDADELVAIPHPPHASASSNVPSVHVRPPNRRAFDALAAPGVPKKLHLVDGLTISRYSPASTASASAVPRIVWRQCGVSSAQVLPSRRTQPVYQGFCRL